MTIYIGQQLNQYQIVSLLGEGGMARVYRARQSTVNREVAIKVINPEFAREDSFRARFEREAQTVAALSHPHILKLFDYGHQDDLTYLVMELMSGGSLNDALENGRLPLPKVSQWLDQVSGALDYAHMQGVIHRDLKPHNVLLDANGNAILTDFGLARMLNRQSQLSESGLMIGTIGYMSPEQWRGEPATVLSDLYALGVMLFEMVAGKRPFDSDSIHGVMYAHLTKLPPLEELPADLPPSVAKVIERALAKTPQSRFPTATTLATEFREALQGKTPTWKLVQITPPLEPLELISLVQTAPLPDSTAEQARQVATASQTVPTPLPPTRRLPLGLAMLATMALTVLAVVGLLAFLRSNSPGGGLPPTPTLLITGGGNGGQPSESTMAPVKANEFAVLVAFLDSAGLPPTMTNGVMDNLRRTVDNIPGSRARIRPLPPPPMVMTNTDARKVASQSHAAVIVWGTLDAAGGDLNVQLGDYRVFASAKIHEDVLRRVTDVKVHITNVNTESIRDAVLNVLVQALMAEGDYTSALQIQAMSSQSTATLPALVDLSTSVAANVVKASTFNYGDYQQGLDAISAAITLDPKNPLLYVDRARFYARLNRPDDVQHDLDNAKQWGLPDWPLPDATHTF